MNTYKGRFYTKNEEIIAAVVSNIANLNLLYLCIRSLYDPNEIDNFAGFVTGLTFTTSVMYHTID